jgi:hypothetical protein
MFTIRQDQLDTLHDDKRRRFVERMVAHLKEYFPRRVESLGEPEVRNLIEDGITRAASYRITAERDVCKFIDIMIVHGRDFDTRFPWAEEILKAEPTDPTAKTNHLFERARWEAVSRGVSHG